MNSLDLAIGLSAFKLILSNGLRSQELKGRKIELAEGGQSLIESH